MESAARPPVPRKRSRPMYPFFVTVSIGILLATAVNGVLALGVTFVIITAGIDLSVGTVMTFSAVMTGVFITNLHLPVPIGILGGILAGTAWQAANICFIIVNAR